MSTATQLSVEEYLKLNAKPAYEYVDGILRQKPMPTTDHGLIQAALIVLLTMRAPQFAVLSEVHVRIRKNEFLVPDLIVVRKDSIERPYPTKPPYLCIEIASPEDRPGQLLAKCEEYHAWGVPYCWVIDPERRTGWLYHRDAAEWTKLSSSDVLSAGELELPLQDVFRELI